MNNFKKLSMTLALLITAATGAWADDATYTVQFKANGKTVTRDVTLPHTFWCNVDYANGELDGIIMELYVITGVGTETATATEVTEVPKGKPFFVLNEEDTENNVTLLPVDDAQVTTTVTPAAEFLGTLEDKMFTADEMAADDYYVLQGGAFVFVKNPGTLAANHCYLKVTKNAAARRLKIVFGDEDTVTGIEGVEGVKEVEGVEDDRFFDLNGRQLDGTPARKGMYIRNGKKVVIK